MPDHTPSLRPFLRLAGALPSEIMLSGRAERRSRRGIERENRAAAAAVPTAEQAAGVQALLAAHVARELQGGRAAAIPADARARLVTKAAHLGVRPFDAHLIIALVQDRARDGAFSEEHHPAAEDAEIAHRPGHRRADHGTIGLLLISLALAAAWFVGLVILLGPR